MKNPLTALETQVRNYIISQRLFCRGERVLLAVSGGADSLAMLYILNALREGLGIDLFVAHFDHLTRGGKSSEEAQLVARHCETLGLEFRGGRAQEGEFRGGNFEEKARKARYAFLRETARELGCCLIATAHQQNDLAETVLLHLLRGCGTEGLAAISPLENGLARPLLCLTREQTESYCRLRGIEYADDETNFETEHLRNKIRLELIPQLETLNPQITAALCRTAELCREENDFLAQYAASLLPDFLQGEALKLEKLQAQPLALRRRLLRAFCESRGLRLSMEQSEACLALREGSHTALPQGCFGIRRGGLFYIADFVPQSPTVTAVDIAFMTGAYNLNNGFSCTVEKVPVPESCKETKNELWLPAAWESELLWSSRRGGDKMTVFGMEGRKSVKDIMNEATLSAEEKASWPVLRRGDEPIWLPLLRKAALPRLDAGTEALYIKISRK